MCGRIVTLAVLLMGAGNALAQCPCSGGGGGGGYAVGGPSYSAATQGAFTSGAPVYGSMPASPANYQSVMMGSPAGPMAYGAGMPTTYGSGMPMAYGSGMPMAGTPSYGSAPGMTYARGYGNSGMMGRMPFMGRMMRRGR